MAVWLGLLGAAFVHLIWLSWFDDRHHRPIVATSAALLAAVYLGVIAVVALSPWVTLPVGLTVTAFVAVEVIVRTLHRLSILEEVRFRPQYPVENP